MTKDTVLMLDDYELKVLIAASEASVVALINSGCHPDSPKMTTQIEALKILNPDSPYYLEVCSKRFADGSPQFPFRAKRAR